MKTTVRPRTTSARTRTARRSHHTPIGLQIAARAFHPSGYNVTFIKARLLDADAAVVRLLHDPIVGLNNHAGLNALSELAREFDTDNKAQEIADVLASPHTQHDPEALVVDFALTQQYAGLFMGLCFGFRIAASGAGKE